MIGVILLLGLHCRNLGVVADTDGVLDLAWMCHSENLVTVFILPLHKTTSVWTEMLH